jgi:glucose/arabinose dehydrogenase
MNSLLTFCSSILLIFSHALFSETAKLPPPDPKHSVVNNSTVIGWKNSLKPKAPPGFVVTKFADQFHNCRWIYETPNKDILIAESEAGRITLLRDANSDGIPEVREVFINNLRKPFGMLVLKNWFYVADEDALWRYPYQAGQKTITGKGEKILDLPYPGYHWTRNIISNKNGDKIYIAIGSSSNIAENGMDKENRRADILEIDPDGKNEKVFASGLRNPVGMDWDPETNTLWTAVNERDLLGDELVPDYMTSVKEDGFYGWPYSYFGNHVDPRVKEQRPDLVKKALVPDLSLGAHTASLGLSFYHQKTFPEKYHNGAFIGQHGSWNSSRLVGYRVVFVPFKKGRPVGPPEDFLTGFIANREKSEVYGRPVGVTTLSDGSLLVADDGGNIIWKVTYEKKGKQ